MFNWRRHPTFVLGAALALGVLSFALTSCLLASRWLGKNREVEPGPPPEYLEKLRVLNTEFKGRRLQAWLDLLNSDDAEEQRLAQGVLFDYAEDQTQTSRARRYVLFQLGRRDQPDLEAVARRASLLLSDDPNREVRLAAARAIQGTG